MRVTKHDQRSGSADHDWLAAPCSQHACTHTPGFTHTLGTLGFSSEPRLRLKCRACADSRLERGALVRLLARFVKVALQLAQVRHRLHADEPAPAVGGVEECAHEAHACGFVG